MASFTVILPDSPEAEQAVQVIMQVVEKLGGQLAPAEDPAAAAGQRQAQVGARANRPSNLRNPVSPAGPAPMPMGPPPM